MAIKDDYKQLLLQMEKSEIDTDAVKTLIMKVGGQIDKIIEDAKESAAGEKRQREVVQTIKTELEQAQEAAKAVSPDELNAIREKAVNYDNLKASLLQKKREDWNAKAQKLNVTDTDAKKAMIDKLKTQFKFPADEKAGLNETDIDYNMAIWSALETTGVFNDNKPDTTYRPAPPPNLHNNTDGRVLTSGEAAVASMKK
jgi:hypothetical protein